MLPTQYPDMAELTRDGTEVGITLSGFEKIEGLRGGTRFRLADVTAVEVLDDALEKVKRLRGEYKQALFQRGTGRALGAVDILIAAWARE